MQILCLGLLLQFSFKLYFDEDTKQAVYVEYVEVTHGGCNSNTSRQIPPGSIPSEYYNNNREYDRGHLVPNFDYGCDSNIMDNIVSQLSKFNQQTWKNMDLHLKIKYPGKTIVKGGKYEGRKMQHNISILEGFLLDNNNIIDNGYVNQFTLETSKELPDWITPSFDLLANSIVV